MFGSRRCLVVDKTDNTQARNLARAAKRFRDLFKGQQCHLRERAQQIISSYSIAACGASDWGVQSVILVL
jgi:hypothetical protein